MKNHLVFVLALAALLPTSGSAQNWGETEGGSIDRVSSFSFGSRYDRPTFTLIGRPAAALPARFSYARPFVEEIVYGAPGRMVVVLQRPQPETTLAERRALVLRHTRRLR